MNYPSHWRMAFLLAIFFHLGVWLAGALILPHLHAAPPPVEEAQALEWESIDDEEEPDDTTEAEQPPPPPSPPKEEPVPPEDEDQTPIIADEDNPAIEEALKEADTDSDSDSTVQLPPTPGPHKKTMAEGAKIISRWYPPIDIVPFKGRVSVAATIGVNGRVTKTQIMVTSGSMSVDYVARDAAKRWIFKPATDKAGNPMESNIIISIAFNKSQWR